MIAVLAVLAAAPAAGAQGFAPRVSGVSPAPAAESPAADSATVDRTESPAADPATVDRALRSTLGRAYGGFWLQGGTRNVAITHAARAADARHLGAEPHLVAHSARELDAIKSALDRRARAVPDTVPDTVAGWGVDVVTNAVVIDVVGRASAALAFARAARAPGDAIRIEHVAERPRLDSNLIGGQAIFNATSRCSIGFNARLGGTRYVLTAGHCTDLAGTTWRQDATTFGSTATSSFPGDDYGTIRVTNAAALSTPLVDRYSAGDDVSVAGSTAVAVGERCAAPEPRPDGTAAR